MNSPGSKSSGPSPHFSIIIPVYNDWEPLESCLESLERQNNMRDFEVIVVDDGSRQPSPKSIRDRGYSLSIVQQPHAGVAAARNRGIRESNGDVLLFTDADCRFQPNCLDALAAAIIRLPDQNSFQLHVRGDCSNMLGRAEELRLIAIQDLLLQSDGRLRYLNTSGFACRRSHRNVNDRLFDPIALRGEDTLLLADLILRAELPTFVSDATVQHSISLSFAKCLQKDVHSAWLEARTYRIIAEKGVKVRMGIRQRIGMLRYTWEVSRKPFIGRKAWFVLIARQSVQRSVSLVHRCLRMGSNEQAAADASRP